MGEVTNLANKGIQTVTGSGSDPGILGLGRFNSDPYSVNGAAFNPSAGENDLMKQMQARAYGQAPSAAELQMRQGLDQANAQAMGLAASQRGISPALAARYAMMNQAGNTQNMNMNAGILRAQEQAQAQGALMGAYQNQRNAQMGLENLKSGNYNFTQGVNQRGYDSAATQRSGFASSIMNGGGLTSMMSGGGGGGGGSGGSGGGGGAMAGGSYMNAAALAAGGGEIESSGQLIQPQAFNHTPSIPDGGGIKDSPYSPKKSGGGGGGIMSLLPLLALLNQGGEVSDPKAPQSSMGKYLNMKRGGVVPGTAAVRGDSLKNDKIPAMLSPKEIVLPRSVTLHPNAPDKAKEFVAAVLARSRRMPPKKSA